MRRYALCLATLVALTAAWANLVGHPASGAPQRRKGDGAAMTFEIYRDRAEGFRWRLKASNGKIVATSGQGYQAKADCRHEIEQIKKNASHAEVEDLSANP